MSQEADAVVLSVFSKQFPTCLPHSQDDTLHLIPGKCQAITVTLPMTTWLIPREDSENRRLDMTSSFRFQLFTIQTLDVIALW